jgi:hypothetical protein
VFVIRNTFHLSLSFVVKNGAYLSGAFFLDKGVGSFYYSKMEDQTFKDKHSSFLLTALPVL